MNYWLTPPFSNQCLCPKGARTATWATVQSLTSAKNCTFIAGMVCWSQAMSGPAAVIGHLVGGNGEKVRSCW